MRRWLLIFLVLLLPMRALVGNAMAGQMSQQGMSAPPVAQHAPAPAMQHGHDCDDALHAAQGASSGAESAAQPHGDCPTCASCQVCSSVALSPAPLLDAGAAFSHPRPQGVQLAYASAEPLLAYKPPRP